MSPTASPRPDRQKLRALLEPVVERSGAELEDLTEQRAGSRRLLRVVVDRDGGVSLDDIADVTRSVSDALDAYDGFGDGAYVLEVTSPGVDRPLTTPRHWRRATGRLVKATLAAGGELVGRVVAADDESVTLLVEQAQPQTKQSQTQTQTQRSLSYGEIAKARMQVEFNRAGDAEDEDAVGDPGDDEHGDEDRTDGRVLGPGRAGES
jgi:ribosome maturation factor RimP